MKYLKSLAIITLAVIIFSTALTAQAAPLRDPVTLYLFYGDGCPHCAQEEIFLDQLKIEYPDLKIERLEVWSNEKNAELLSKVAAEIKITAGGVPVTVVGSQAVVGFDDAQGIGREIEQMVASAYAGPYEDMVRRLAAGTSGGQPTGGETGPAASGNGKQIKSIFGEINTRNLSLPALTAVIGLLDSLNPCALWVLLFLISMLVGMNNRRRMWLLGWSFILGSAIAYYAFLAAWLNIFLFIGFIKWIRYAIAIFAIGSGVYNLRKYWQNREGGCEVVSDPSRRKTMERLKLLVQDKRLLLAMAGILLLAGSINLIELLCSAGLPAIYIQTLTMAGLPKATYYLYLLLYVFFYVLDQIIIFVIAMLTFQIKAISSRITTYTVLIGGLLMLAMGLILLLRPAWLAFG